MNQDQLRKLAQKIINKEKWSDMLSRFIEVLRINIFIVDSQGLILLPPEKRKYGGRLLTDRSLGFDLFHGPRKLIEQFEQQAQFLESVNRFELHSFAIPINSEGNKTIAYMIVGPVMLNKRLENSVYENFAKGYGIKKDQLIEEINEIRVVSNVMMNSILDLLSEIIRDTVELSIKEQELDKIKLNKEAFPEAFREVAKEIYSTVRLDELLVTLLDTALKMTNTECGSIMVIDEKQGDLTIKVSRGLNNQRLQDTRVKIGEGIAGIAAKENSSFVIRGDQGDNRIKHLLRRPDIKHALVMPLISKEHVFGVLNLHTKKEYNTIEDNLDNLQYLSKLLSSVF